MHYACALSNRVRGNNHMSMHLLTAYVYCMSSSIHSARDAPSRPSTWPLPSSITQPDVRTYTTDLNKHQIAHNTQRAPAQITRNVLRPFPHGRSPTLTIPLAHSKTEIDL